MSIVFMQCNFWVELGQESHVHNVLSVVAEGWTISSSWRLFTCTVHYFWGFSSFAWSFSLWQVLLLLFAFLFGQKHGQLAYVEQCYMNNIVWKQHCISWLVLQSEASQGQSRGCKVLYLGGGRGRVYIARCQLVTLTESIRHFATDDCLTRWS